jgi:NDP-sugar pyrophosphorylase family protein
VTQYISDYISCGIYVLGDNLERFFVESKAGSLHQSIPDDNFEGPSLGFHKTKKGNIDFKSNFEILTIPAMIQQQEVGTVSLDPVKDILFEITSTSDLVKANGMFLNKLSLERDWRTFEYLEATKADIPQMGEGIYIHPSAKVGEGCEIGPNTYIGKSVVLGRGVKVKNAIVLGGCEIDDYCFIQDAIIGFNASVGKWARIEGHEEKDKVTVVGVGARVDSEVHLFDCLVIPNRNVYFSYYHTTVL